MNDLHKAAHNYGVPHRKGMEEVPLKVFIKCEDCSQPFTGYIVKAKGTLVLQVPNDGLQVQ